MSNYKIKNCKDTVSGTFLVIFILCLVCSIAVSITVVVLKSKQKEQKLLDKQRNILNVVGLLKSKASDKEIQVLYRTRISAKILDFKTLKISNSNSKLNFSSRLYKDEAIVLLSKQDFAKIRYRANKVEIYLVNDDSGKVMAFVLPIYGSGLWSMMYGFIAVDIDGVTLRGIIYYSHSETPGLGGEVDNPQWRSQWIGKKLYNQQGKPIVKIVHSNSSNIINDYSVIDGLSGATLTSNSIQKMFDFWLSSSGFGPFLSKVRKGELIYDS